MPAKMVHNIRLPSSKAYPIGFLYFSAGSSLGATLATMLHNREKKKKGIKASAHQLQGILPEYPNKDWPSWCSAYNFRLTTSCLSPGFTHTWQTTQGWKALSIHNFSFLNMECIPPFGFLDSNKPISLSDETHHWNLSDGLVFSWKKSGGRKGSTE